MLTPTVIIVLTLLSAISLIVGFTLWFWFHEDCEIVFVATVCAAVCIATTTTLIVASMYEETYWLSFATIFGGFAVFVLTISINGMIWKFGRRLWARLSNHAVGRLIVRPMVDFLCRRWFS